MDPQSMDHPCGPSPWPLSWAQSMDYPGPCGPPLIVENELIFIRSLNKFSNLEWMKLWSAFIIRVMGSPYFTLAQFFFSIFPYQCNGSFYSCEGLMIFEVNRRSGRKEVFVYAALFFFCLHVAWKLKQKLLCMRLRKKINVYVFVMTTVLTWMNGKIIYMNQPVSVC